MVLRNFYVEVICDIVQSDVNGFIDVQVVKSIEHYPVQISVEDGHKYYWNLEELNYIKYIIDNQKEKKFNKQKLRHRWTEKTNDKTVF